MDNRRQTDIYSVQADFETAFWGTGKIECGVKWLSTITDYHTTDTLLQAAAPAVSTLSAFRYSEYVAALYLTKGKQFGDHWTNKIGLRGEHTLSLG